MTHEIVTEFSCLNQELIGICHSGKSDTGFIIVTGGPQYRIGSHRQFLLIARTLAKASYPVFRFDYRDMGDSYSRNGQTGSYNNITFDQSTDDIIAAIKEFKQLQPQVNKIILLGLCDAASAILIALPQIKLEIKQEISGVILINPWVYQEKTIAKTYLKYYYFDRLQQSDFWLKLFKLQINLAHSVKSLLKRYKLAFSQHNKQKDSDFINKMLLGLLDFKGNILTILSEEDLTAKEFQLLVKENKIWDDLLSKKKHKQLLLADADHTFSSKENRNKVISYILDWV